MALSGPVHSGMAASAYGAIRAMQWPMLPACLPAWRAHKSRAPIQMPC